MQLDETRQMLIHLSPKDNVYQDDMYNCPPTEVCTALYDMDNDNILPQVIFNFHKWVSKMDIFSTWNYENVISAKNVIQRMFVVYAYAYPMFEENECLYITKCLKY